MNAFSFALLGFCFLGVAQASNGDNHFCRGCAVTIEHAWHELADMLTDANARVTAGTQQNVTIDIDNRIAKYLCDKPYWKDYTHEIKEGCKQIVDVNRFIIGEAFGGDQATPATVYKKIDFACRERMDLCDGLADDAAVLERYGERQSPCDECLTVVRDVQDVLMRKKGSSGYLSRKHVWSVLEDACTAVLVHHPAPHALRLQERCEQLLEEFDDDIADVFSSYDFAGPDPTVVPRTICGRGTAGLCKNRLGEWDGVQSPWAASPGTEKDEL